MSRDEGRVIEEETFPHTFNAKMSLCVTGIGPARTSPNTRRNKRANNVAATQDVNETVDDGPPAAKKTMVVEESEDIHGDNSKTQHDLSAHLAKIDEMVEKTRRSGSLGTAGKTRSSLKKSMRLTSLEGDANSAKMQSGPSQGGGGPESQQIEWKDPREEEEQKILRARLSAETQALKEAMDTGGNETQGQVRNNANALYNAIN